MKKNTITTFKIDDNTYDVLDDITLDDNRYVYLINEEDEDDFFVKRITIDDGDNVIINSLLSEEEFDKAMKAFEEKNNDN